MPFVNKTRRKRTHSTWLFLRFNKTVRFGLPDRLDSVTMPWPGGRRTIWERAK
jgi:hypothetical protein